MEEIRTGALYIRVSTHMQEDLSPDAQKRLLLEYAEKNRIIVSNEHVFIDEGISGRKADKRPEFQKMIGYAKSKEHPFDVILVWKFSRFARNQEESIVYKSMLARDKVDVISISEPIADDPFGSLMERIIEWMDEYYSIRLSGEVTRGMMENAMRGNFQSSPPTGYCMPHKKAIPQIVPDEAETVRMIFNMYTEDGMSIYEITRKLNSMGIKSKRNNSYEKRTVEYILKNVFYTGKNVWYKREKKDSRQPYRDESEWIVTEGKHEPIISEEQFRKARGRMESEYSPSYRKPSGICKHWLSGLLKCSACGRSLSTSVHTDKRYGVVYTNFQCYGYSKGICTVSHSISEKKIVPAVLSEIKRVIDTRDINFSYVKPSNDNKLVESIRKSLESLSVKEKRIKDAYINGIDSMDEYRANKDVLSKERESLEKQLSVISEQHPLTDGESIDSHLEKLKSVHDVLAHGEGISMQKRNELAKSVIEKIVYCKSDNSISIFFYLS